MNKKCFKALSLTHRLMCFCEWIDFRSCWLLVPLDQPEVLLVPEDQSLCPLTAAAVSYCCCCCCCVFEATTPTLIKTSLTKKKEKSPRMWFPPPALSAPQWRNLSVCSEVSQEMRSRLTSPRIEWRSGEPDLSILTGNSCSILQKKKKKKITFTSVSSPTGRRLTAGWTDG